MNKSQLSEINSDLVALLSGIKLVLTDGSNFTGKEHRDQSLFTAIFSISDMFSKPMNSINAVYHACFKDGDEMVFSNHPYFQTIKPEAVDQIEELHKKACQIVSEIPEDQLDEIFEE